MWILVENFLSLHFQQKSLDVLKEFIKIGLETFPGLSGERKLQLCLPNFQRHPTKPPSRSLRNETKAAKKSTTTKHPKLTSSHQHTKSNEYWNWWHHARTQNFLLSLLQFIKLSFKEKSLQISFLSFKFKLKGLPLLINLVWQIGHSSSI